MRWEICVEKSIRLAYSWRADFKKIYVNVAFLRCFMLYLGAISKHKPPGAYIERGDLPEGFLRYKFGGLLFREVYFRNPTVLKLPRAWSLFIAVLFPSVLTLGT